MSDLQEKMLPEAPDVLAPDGSEVRLLCATQNGSAAHFTLLPGQTSKAIRHRTVEEIWFITGGGGEMWRKSAAAEKTVVLTSGLSLTIPVGTEFQFRNTGDVPMTAVAITMPAWPGAAEAVFVDGPWPA